MSLKYDACGLIDNKLALTVIMVWCQTDDKHYLSQRCPSLLMNIYVIKPQ